MMKKATFLWILSASALTCGVAVAESMTDVSSVVSSLKVVAKQQAASSAKADATGVASASALASVYADISNREQVLKTVNDFGETGQLVDPCYQVSMADTAAGTAERTSSKAQAVMALQGRMSADGEVKSSGVVGMLGGSKKVADYPFGADVNKRINRHLDRYCSVSEASAGYCTLNANGMQSGDTDFSMHLAGSKTYGWDQAEAASDFAKTIAPIDPVPQYGDCSSVECRAALAERRRDDAMMSLARFSMVQFIETRTTQADGEAKKSGGQ
jgi:hypothetical protein